MPSEIDTAAIAAERQRYFTPRWFMELLTARLSLGDTFWIGSYGTLLVIVPLGTALLLIAQWVLSPGQFRYVTNGTVTVMALYHAALLTAVVRTALRAPQVGGWRWLGVLIALFNAGFMAAAAYAIWTGALARWPGLSR